MAFPLDPLGVTVELDLPGTGTWTDITDFVYVRDGISIKRGRTGESVTADPSSCELTLNNTDGRFSPRNPTSPYYPQLGRNTKIRVEVNGSTRFIGEVSEWPVDWDPSGSDVYAQIEAAGILRRLSQGSAPLPSVIRRALTADDQANPPVAYWPMEDEAEATTIASALDNGDPMTVSAVTEFADFDGFVASAPLPTIGSNAARGQIGTVPAYTPTTETQLRFLFHITTGVVAGQSIAEFYSTGTASRWRLIYTTGGGLEFRAFDDDDVQLATTGAGIPGGGLDGRLWRVSLEMTQVGANIDFGWVVLEVGADVAVTLSTTLNSRTVGRIASIALNPVGGLVAGSEKVTYGHLSVQTDVTPIHDLADELTGFNGEPAGRRVQRLCGENDIAFGFGGNLDDTAAMGPQRPGELLDLLDECADADLGLLDESRSPGGLLYKTRAGLYNQTPDATLSYEGSVFASAPRPVDDDQRTRNDVTVKRVVGSSARAVDTSGPLSTQSPPNGVGIYADKVTVNIVGDGFLPNQASWRLMIGTTDEARYPDLHFDLAAPAFAGLLSTVYNRFPGDVLLITDLPPWLPPDDVRVMVMGYSEVLEPFAWNITFTTVPSSPFDVAVYGDTLGDDPSKYDTGGTIRSLAAPAITTTQTSIDFQVTVLPLWTTDDDETPFDIYVGGERMTVTDIAGTASPQTFTVVRSVNGVVKTHAPGTPVRLWNTPRYGL